MVVAPLSHSDRLRKHLRVITKFQIQITPVNSMCECYLVKINEINDLIV